MAKKKESKQKKMNVRVDFTPMVDMLMLLITFFMLCTTLSKPQTMELTMPSNDENRTNEQERSQGFSDGDPLHRSRQQDLLRRRRARVQQPRLGERDYLGQRQGHPQRAPRARCGDGQEPVKRFELAVKKLNMDKKNNPQNYTVDSICQRS